MKISTFNLNGVRHRLPLLLEWLAEAVPDVVCLQEINATDADFPRRPLLAAGYRALWQSHPSSGGIAILAKGQDPIEIRRGLPGADDAGSYLEAKVNGLIIGCVYLVDRRYQPKAIGGDRLSDFERLIRHARSLGTTMRPAILAGDYHVAPDDLDLGDTQFGLQDMRVRPDGRAAYQRLLAEGWIDTLRTLFPQVLVFTYWDQKRNDWHRNSGLRVDHLLLSAQLDSRLIAGGVDTWVRDDPRAGDHAPAWIVLAGKESPPSVG